MYSNSFVPQYSAVFHLSLSWSLGKLEGYSFLQTFPRNDLSVSDEGSISWLCFRVEFKGLS